MWWWGIWSWRGASGPSTRCPGGNLEGGISGPVTPARNESGMKLFLFPNLLSRLHGTGTKSTLYEWVNQNESRNEWIKTKFKWMKWFQAVWNRTVFGCIHDAVSSWRTVFISYRIQMIFMPVSCRRNSNPRHRVNGASLKVVLRWKNCLPFFYRYQGN